MNVFGGAARAPNRNVRVITSQLPLEHWHAWLQDPTLADAILDRLAHQAHKLPVKGDSMRRNTKSDSADA
ncbi:MULTISPECIES: ATP-binding protein [Paraburkholderia]|uniref:ATP-binding protein n=1 Tax=Paraburkholderia TaxID=1822464 RepID=UPI00288A870F|nr:MULTISPECIES: ATP-binding protein [Paraburkholderia]